MTTPEQINDIREWARSENRPRRDRNVPREIVELTWGGRGDSRSLSPAGLTIAALAEALEQANATAAVASGAGREYACLPATIELASIETMRANRRRLLG